MRFTPEFVDTDHLFMLLDKYLVEKKPDIGKPAILRAKTAVLSMILSDNFGVYGDLKGFAIIEAKEQGLAVIRDIFVLAEHREGSTFRKLCDQMQKFCMDRKIRKIVGEVGTDDARWMQHLEAIGMRPEKITYAKEVSWEVSSKTPRNKQRSKIRSSSSNKLPKAPQSSPG